MKKSSLDRSLHKAISDNDISKIQLLFENGANLNSKQKGMSALTLAVDKHNIKIIEFLIHSGADLNQRCDDSLTPIAKSALLGDSESFMLLAKSGANLALTYDLKFNGRDVENNTLLLLASIGGKLKICQYLCNSNDVLETSNTIDMTPLLVALHFDREGIAKYLLSIGANPNPKPKSTNLDWMSPLMVATGKGTLHIIRSLIQNGANVNSRFLGISPLKIAAKEGKGEVVNELLNAGANVDAVDFDGWTPLMTASTEGYLEVASLLIARGANVNHTAPTESRAANTCDTPLMIAAYNGHYELVKLLIDSGASINIQNHIGSSALSFALQSFKRSVDLNGLSSLLGSESEINSFYLNLRSKALNILELLIQNNADLDISVDGKTLEAYLNSFEEAELQLLKNRYFPILGQLYSKSSDADRSSPDDLLHWEIIRSKQAKEQMSRAHSLIEEICKGLDLILPAQSPENQIVIRDIKLALSLSQEAFDPIFDTIDAPWYDEDGDHDDWNFSERTSSMTSGPFYTSRKYRRDKSWMPVLQLNLEEMSRLIGVNFGDGLLQLWYPQGVEEANQSNAKIIIIPRSSVQEKLMTRWSLPYDPEPCEINLDPIPVGWDRFFWNGEISTHTIKKVVSNGIRCPDVVLNKCFTKIKSSLSEDMSCKIEELLKICKFEPPASSSRSGDQLGLFGTFQFDGLPNLYTATSVAKKCLLNITGWGDGVAQIFFSVEACGGVTFEFRDSWKPTIYDESKMDYDRDRYRGKY